MRGKMRSELDAEGTARAYASYQGLRVGRREPGSGGMEHGAGEGGTRRHMGRGREGGGEGRGVGCNVMRAGQRGELW